MHAGQSVGPKHENYQAGSAILVLLPAERFRWNFTHSVQHVASAQRDKARRDQGCRQRTQARSRVCRQNILSQVYYQRNIYRRGL